MRGSAHLINYIAMPALHLLTHSRKSLGCAAYIVNWLKRECASMYGCVWELFEIPYDLPTHWAWLQYGAQSFRKQTCSLICVAHCNELAKYSQAFRKKRESPTSEFMTLGSACGLFLCMPEWHGNCRKSVWPVSMLSHLQLHWIFPFFFLMTRGFCWVCYLITQAIHHERPREEQHVLMKRNGKDGKETRSA